VGHNSVDDVGFHVLGLLLKVLLLLVHLGKLLLHPALGLFILKRLVNILIQSAPLLSHPLLHDSFVLHRAHEPLQCVELSLVLRVVQVAREVVLLLRAHALVHRRVDSLLDNAAC
jgi:hypothetical protein